MSPVHLIRNQVHQGDASVILATLPSDYVDCVVTSPPYFRLRDYGISDQLGLEAHVDQWVAELQSVCQEIARVLVPTGTLWLNLGDAYSTHPREGARRKSLLLGPERLALALLGDGWVIRNKIVWAKTNTIPSSVRDRLSTAHEFVYVLARQPRYFFDLDAIRQPHTSKPPKRRRPRPTTTGPPKRRDQGRSVWLGPNSDGDGGLAAMQQAGRVGHPLGKNPGDVWALSVSRYRGAHFATYPEHLVKRMVRAGCPERRCSACQMPWTRPLRRLGATAIRLSLQPGCQCEAPSEPGLVLDPFLGSGTTAVVAERLGRDWIGIELNSEFVALAEQRIADSRANAPQQIKRKEVT